MARINELQNEIDEIHRNIRAIEQGSWYKITTFVTNHLKQLGTGAIAIAAVAWFKRPSILQNRAIYMGAAIGTILLGVPSFLIYVLNKQVAAKGSELRQLSVT